MFLPPCQISTVAAEVARVARPCQISTVSSYCPTLQNLTVAAEVARARLTGGAGSGCRDVRLQGAGASISRRWLDRER